MPCAGGKGRDCAVRVASERPGIAGRFRGGQRTLQHSFADSGRVYPSDLSRYVFYNNYIDIFTLFWCDACPQNSSVITVNRRNTPSVDVHITQDQCPPNCTQKAESHEPDGVVLRRSLLPLASY